MTVEARIFVDTNVLVYAYDADAGKKHEIARDLVARLWRSREGTLSTQVLQEFYVTVTRKLLTPLDPTTARRVVATYQGWPLMTIDVMCILDAIEISERNQLSFWEGLIVAAARQAGAERVMTEDLQSGRPIEGLVIESPFGTEFTRGNQKLDFGHF